ncbi:DNA repair protein Rad62 [Anopheles darlingi]|uniref:Non-structural maintenance of chromosomes element 4 n=1 Tax=Anopheles darlingi TaxID=43151 RepID=W5JFY0_ANODA|nr:DNA repair protein Rad62 [Anopheles darlingi]
MTTERRKRYQKLIDQGRDIALRTQTENAVDIFQSVSSLLESNETLMQECSRKDRPENASEISLNVQIVKMSHELVSAAMQKSESSQFCDAELTTAIMTMIGSTDGQQNWHLFGKTGITAFCMSKHTPSLFGTFDFNPAPVENTVKERRRRERVELGEARKPTTVHKLNQEETDARKLQDILEQLKLICEKKGPKSAIAYYELITDPTDFMNTIDTAFQISFLIQKGVVVLETVDGAPFVRPTSEAEKQHARNIQNDENVQAILSFNYAKWQESINRYGLKRPMLRIDRDIIDSSALA